MKRKNFMALLVAATVVGGTSVPAYAANYSDVPEEAKTYVESVDGVIEGISETKFGVSKEITAYDIADTLYGLSEYPEGKKDAFGNDDTAYANAVSEWINGMNLYSGLKDENAETEIVDVSQDRVITRQELGQIVFNYAQSEGKLDLTENNEDLTSYEDSAKIADENTDAMKWAVGNHVIICDDLTTDEEETVIRPEATATKLDLAIAVSTYKDLVKKAEVTTLLENVISDTTITSTTATTSCEKAEYDMGVNNSEVGTCGGSNTGNQQEPGVDNPDEPGTGNPEDPGTGNPEDPGTDNPDEPGTGDPEDPGTDNPEDPGTGDPEDPGTDNPDEPGTGDPEDPGTDNPEDPDVHEHVWIDNIITVTVPEQGHEEIIHHPEQGHEEIIHHPEEGHNVFEVVSVCSYCGAEITGAENAHIKNHLLNGEPAGWHEEERNTWVVDKEAWDETVWVVDVEAWDETIWVVDVEAWDETIWVVDIPEHTEEIVIGKICSECGEIMSE